jgi:hypothetical protein
MWRSHGVGVRYQVLAGDAEPKPEEQPNCHPEALNLLAKLNGTLFFRANDWIRGTERRHRSPPGLRLQ